jgi:hypothetical protein
VRCYQVKELFDELDEGAMGTVPYDEFVDILVATDTANLGRFGSIISIMNMDDSAGSFAVPLTRRGNRPRCAVRVRPASSFGYICARHPQDWSTPDTFSALVSVVPGKG